MSHSNKLVGFLRHYGPIPTSDNMYDERIHSEIEHYGIEKPIEIEPVRLNNIIENFESENPKNVILTGTAGDGKTYHCRGVWEHFNCDSEYWKSGNKRVSLKLPASHRNLNIVKDLSELTESDKGILFPELANAVRQNDSQNVFLIAANDGQLLGSWRDFAEKNSDQYLRDFCSVEEMLVDGKVQSDNLSLLLYNLSDFNVSEIFGEIVNQVTEHPQWHHCNGCPLLNEDGSSICPIRINRDRLRDTEGNPSIFRHRLTELLKIARANRMHLPIRDLLLLSVNILLGDRKENGLLTCRKAINRANARSYQETNPYSNAFGANLRPRQRQQYQAFSTLESFGIGRETDNKFDNLLIYGTFEEDGHYKELVGNDEFYGDGDEMYTELLYDYLYGERKYLAKFMRSLTLQRQRLFFTLPINNNFYLSPWFLSVYQYSGQFLEFGEKIKSKSDYSYIANTLVRGLNRTFCGMMIDDSTQLYIASSGGDGRGRIASILKFKIDVSPQKRNPFLDFELANDGLTPRVIIVDPIDPKKNRMIDQIDLKITHFEYLMRVAKGSLPASFSRQCYEDFLDFKLRIIKHLQNIIGDNQRPNLITFQAVKIDESGRLQPDIIQIKLTSS
ncbi:MAG: hypothetical protein OXE59_06185 [Bacteroidetes bacterium]|nr:hypothetical protein [Bacteroidota bacterium]